MTLTYHAETTQFSPPPLLAQLHLTPAAGRTVAESTAARGKQGRLARTSATGPELLPNGQKAKASRVRPTRSTGKQSPARTASANCAGKLPDLLSDRDLAITLLSRCLSLKMAAEATEAILTRYGSYAEAVAAPLHELRAIPSVGDTAATLLKCIHSSVARLTSIPLRQNPVLKDWPALSAYLNVCIGHERTEFCRVLFLNAKNYLIADQILSEGDINSVQVPIRAITKRALELEATGLILVHNHPSGDPTPSEADRVMTERVSHAVSTFGIVVHDHIIVGKSECFSMQRRAYMASYQPTSTS